jgi:hypothetical protein
MNNIILFIIGIIVGFFTGVLCLGVVTHSNTEDEY